MALRHQYLIDAVYAYEAASDSGDLEAYGQAEAAYLVALIKAQQDVDICCPSRRRRRALPVDRRSATTSIASPRSPTLTRASPARWSSSMREAVQREHRHQ
jgi:hypothetical protein